MNQSGIVIQQSNTERGDAFAVSHTVFAPGSGEGAPLVSELPKNAIGLRWSPDGTHVVYAIREAPVGLRGYDQPSYFVADRDGRNPNRVELLHSADWYASHQWWAGAVWTLTGDLFALVWDSGSCSGGPDCMPPTGIDVFDLSGARVAALDTPDTMSADVAWSPDGASIGWHSGACAGGSCSNHEFNWRPLADGGTVTSLSSPSNISVKWAPDDRLRIITFDDAGLLQELYSSAPDASDVTNYEWDRESTPGWSPNGQLLAAVDYAANELIVRDVEGGDETIIELPPGLAFAAWSPDSDQIALYGEPKSSEGGSDYGFYIVNADGSGEVQYLADGEDFAFMPSSVEGQGE